MRVYVDNKTPRKELPDENDNTAHNGADEEFFHCRSFGGKQVTISLEKGAR